MKTLKMILMILLFVMLMAPQRVAAVGPFGPPEPIVKKAGGLHTGIGYWFHEDQYENGAAYVTRQNQIYSELGYGSRKGWEITARVGMSDFKMADAFGSGAAATTTSKRDFEERGKFFSTLGAKGFYPFTGAFGLGVFAQGTYYFSDFTDNISGTRAGSPYSLDLAVKNLWDVNVGMGFQVTGPRGIKAYAGPYIRYSEMKVSPSGNVAGLALTAGETTLKNRTVWGGFTGIEVPLAKGFSLNLEGQYAERFSIGAAVLLAY